MERIGLDIGTKNIVLTKTQPKKKIVHEVNGFLPLEKGDGFTKQLLMNSGVPYIEYDSNFIALGRKAEELSYAFNRTLQRPMQDGVLSGKTEEAMQIMASIIHSIIGKLNDDAIMYYSIPADALNAKTNVAFHDKIIQMIIAEYGGECKIAAHPINEARAIVIGEIEDKTAVAISAGAGMVNVCYCLYGIDIYSFSLVGAGDKIDLDTAMRFGYDPDRSSGDYKETPTSISRRKERMSLLACPEDMVGKAIWINYGILIESVVKGIVNGFKEHEEKARIERPIPIIVAGGTSMPEGFIKYFKEVINRCEIPFEVGDVKRAENPLYAVSEGCLTAATMHQDD